MPTRDGHPCVVIDMGANIACKPSHLAAYGVMASIYSNKMFNIPQPRVGLLNVGEERSKGNESLREAFGLLEEAPVNFVGNVEGGDIFSGACDVVVCDGFIGNVVLKAAETLSSTISSWLRQALHSSWRAKLAALAMQGSLQQVKGRLDYTAYGGAPLLGVNGVCLIGHGRSRASAVASALRSARENVKTQMNAIIREKIERLRHSVRLKAIGGTGSDIEGENNANASGVAG